MCNTHSLNKIIKAFTILIVIPNKFNVNSFHNPIRLFRPYGYQLTTYCGQLGELPKYIET